MCGVFSLTNDDVDGVAAHRRKIRLDRCFMEARRGKVKEDKFLVNFKRLLINGQQYFTNVEKFEIKSGNLKEATAKLFFLSRLSAKQKSIIYQIKKAYNFYLYVHTLVKFSSQHFNSNDAIDPYVFRIYLKI